MLHPVLARSRAAAARAARLIVFPNEERAHFAQSELRFSDNRLHIVWNVPRRAELASSAAPAEPPLIVYYHGSITPERLPETVAVRGQANGRPGPASHRRLRSAERARLCQAPCRQRYRRGSGYPDRIYRHGASRADLLTAGRARACRAGAHAFQLKRSQHAPMTGASNKPFDYMAAGLALLVSDLPDWKTMFVEPGFGLACDPTDADSLSAALGWFIDHPEARRAMAARARNKIEAEWNYDTQFRAVLESLEST